MADRDEPESPESIDGPPTPLPPQRTNYVLIDFENLQPSSLDLLTLECVRVLVFVGASQAKIPFDVAASLQRLGTRVEYVKIGGNGPNALDFHIAYYIGTLSAADPTASFHVISKDTGFDPLIRHLRERTILVARCTTIIGLPFVRVVVAPLIEERSALVLKRLRDMAANRPRTVAALGKMIGIWFKKTLSQGEVMAILQELEKRDVLAIDGPRVYYAIPADE